MRNLGHYVIGTCEELLARMCPRIVRNACRSLASSAWCASHARNPLSAALYSLPWV